MDRRQKLRKGPSELKIVVLQTADLLLEQGYELVCEAAALSPGLNLPAPTDVRRWVISYFAPMRGLIVAGLKEGRLLGFCTTVAMNGAAYQEMLHVSVEGRKHHLTLCFFHCTASIVSRSTGLCEVMNGLHLRERRGVSSFKPSLGRGLVHLPARLWLALLTKLLLRRLRPHVHYRLTGDRC